MTLRKSLLISALMLAGCGRMDREEEFRSVLPTKEMVELKTPEKSGLALTSGEAVNASRYLYASYTLPQVQYGTEATDCAFATASDSSL